MDPEVLGAYRAWPTTRAADKAAVCEHLGVRPFDVDEDGARLSQVLREKVAHTGSTAALLDAAEDWLVRQGLLRPTGESTIERLLYSARAAARGSSSPSWAVSSRRARATTSTSSRANQRCP